MAGWNTVRVFISSTFQDMHAERDYLVKRVFPQLRERLLPYRIHLVDIDLRWGITQEEAENDRVLDLCLQQIDESRPFFVGILGERYGWVPERMPEMDHPEYGWVEALTGKSVTELEIMHGVLRNPGMRGHAFFYFRDAGFCSRLTGDDHATFVDEGQDAAKLAALKEEIRASRYPVFEPYPAGWDASKHRVTGLDAFGDRILEDLWDGVRAEHELPDEPPAFDDAPLARERDFHDRFVESRTRAFIGREAPLRQLENVAQIDNPHPCLVTGPSGSGKSALLARFVTRYQERHPDDIMIAHFVGASPRSTGLRDTLQRFCQEMKATFGFEDEIPLETTELARAFGTFIAKVPDDNRLILVVDALNQLDKTERAHSMYWLPREFPDQVKFIGSCIADAGRNESILQGFGGRRAYHLEVPALTPEERFEIATEIPSVSAKKLDGSQIQRLLGNPATENPLYLLVALEELRGFGSFEELNARIGHLPQGDDPVTALFIQVIERLERDFERASVHDVLTLLACARRGLSQGELLELIEGHSELTGSTSELFPILRQIRPYLQHRGDLLDFFHRNFYKAVRANYLEAEPEGQSSVWTETHEANDHEEVRTFAERQVHDRLADYFGAQPNYGGDGTPNNRRCDELPWQLMRAERAADLKTLLTNIGFLQAKVDGTGPQPLIEDFELADTAQFQTLGLIQGAVRLASVEIDRNPNILLSQLFGRLCESNDDGVRQFLTETIRFPSSPWLQPLRQSLTCPTEQLWRTLSGSPDSIQCVAVAADGRTVFSGLGGSFAGTSGLMLWDSWSGQCLRELECEDLKSWSVAVSKDGKTGISLTDSILIFDLATGAVRHRIEVQTCFSKAFAVTPDCRRAIVAVYRGSPFDYDYALLLLDLKTGDVQRTIDEVEFEIPCVAISADAQIAISGSQTSDLHVWGLFQGTKKLTLRIPGWAETFLNHRADKVAIADDGSVAAAAYGESIGIWDLVMGKLLRISQGHSDEIESLAIASGPGIIVSASRDATVGVWHIESGAELCTLKGHTGGVQSVAVTPDGRTVVTGSTDATVKVWDLSDVVQQLSSADGRVSRNVGNTDWVVDENKLIKGAVLEPESLILNADARVKEVESLMTTCDGQYAISRCGKKLTAWEFASGSAFMEAFATADASTCAGTMAATSLNPRRTVLANPESSELEIWPNEPFDYDVQRIPLDTCHGRVTSVAITPTAHVVVAAFSDSTLKTWNAVTGELLQTLHESSGPARSIHLVGDGGELIYHSGDGMTTKWDLNTCRRLHTRQSMAERLSCVLPTKAGDTLLVGTTENCLRVWVMDSHSEVAEFACEAAIKCCAVSARRNCVAVGDSRGNVSILRLHGLKMIDVRKEREDLDQNTNWPPNLPGLRNLHWYPPADHRTGVATLSQSSAGPRYPLQPSRSVQPIAARRNRTKTQKLFSSDNRRHRLLALALVAVASTVTFCFAHRLGIDWPFNVIFLAGSIACVAVILKVLVSSGLDALRTDIR